MRLPRVARWFLVALALGGGLEAGPTRRPKTRYTPYFVGGSVTGIEAPGAARTPRARGPVPADLPGIEQALRLDPSRVELWVAKARHLEARGRPRPARRAYEEALRLDARDRGARLGLGRLLVEAGLDPEQGRALLEPLLTGGAEDAPVLGVLGAYFMRKGEDGLARQRLRKAVELAPRDADALYQLGLLEVRDGNNARALHLFGRVLRVDPRHTRAHISRAMIYGQYRERTRALESYATAWHLMKGEGPAAREVLARMRELDPFADPSRMKVRIPEPVPDPKETPAPRAPARPPVEPRPRAVVAAPATAAAARKAPGPDLSAPAPATERPRTRQAAPEPLDPVGRLERMALMYRRYGLYEEASSAYHAVIARGPTSDAARRAQSAIEELWPFVRPDRELRVRQLRSLAGFLVERRDRAGAREALERILLLDPEDVAAWRDLAYLAVREGDLEEGLAHVRRALEVAPGDPEALLIQGYALARQRKFSRALVIYRAVEEGRDVPERVRDHARAMLRALDVFADTP